MSNASDLTNQIINFIYEQGGYAWRAQSSGVFDRSLGGYRSAPKKGVSDVLACWRGRFIAIEVKIGKDRLSNEQIGFIRNIQHVGGIAFIARDYDTFVSDWKSFVNIC